MLRLAGGSGGAGNIRRHPGTWLGRELAVHAEVACASGAHRSRHPQPGDMQARDPGVVILSARSCATEAVLDYLPARPERTVPAQSAPHRPAYRWRLRPERPCRYATPARTLDLAGTGDPCGRRETLAAPRPV